MLPICQLLLSAPVLKFRRHTIAEAKDSVDRLHALVEQCYKEMSFRVQALEVLDMRERGNADWMSGRDTESLATIHAHPLDLSSEESSGSEPVRFDFSDDLQRSRVYRRNQAFRKSVISALTNSVYSLGWSIFSDLSMAEVSNISVINLGITEGETFNFLRSSQTWSSQTNDEAPTGPYTENNRDGQRTQPNNVVGKSVSAEKLNSSIAQGLWPLSTPTRQPSLPRAFPHFTSSTPPQILYHSDCDSSYWPEDHFGEKINAKTADTLDPTSSLPLSDPSDPLSPSQPQPNSLQFHEIVEGEPFYTCKGCGEVLEERKAYKLGRSSPF